MEKVITKTAHLSAIGPYSLAREVGNTLYCSGQIGIDVEKKLVKGGAIEEFKQIIENVREMLHAAGYKMNDVVKVVLYITNMDDFKDINGVYRQSFNQPYPVRTTVEVGALPIGAHIEVEITAVKQGVICFVA